VKVDRAQVVDAVQVVGVGVGQDHRVDHVDAFAQELLAQVGRRVDQHARGRRLHHD